MKRTLALAILTMICAGCAGDRVGRNALAVALEKPIDQHASALSGDDVIEMRRTGRVVIAIYDAAVGK